MYILLSFDDGDWGSSEPAVHKEVSNRVALTNIFVGKLVR
jgi:hypothetical protein